MQKYQTVIILGAPRSGTNMLRDAMCRLPGFATWPCDELNPLWRTGNTGYPSDAIPISQLSPRIEHRIRSAFDRQARSHQCDVLVEKTCANCLRPQFVRKCFPNAKFLQIVRNVVDTTSSTVGRWNAPSDYRYLLQKARFVPLRDLPRTVARAAIRRICRGGAPQARPWGPVLSADVLPAGALLSESAYAALQWTECVRRTDEMLAELPATQSCTIKYEQFVVDPAPALIAAMAQLNFNVDSADVDVATGPVHRRSVGRGQGMMDAQTQSILETHAANIMHRHGYKFDVED